MSFQINHFMAILKLIILLFKIRVKTCNLCSFEPCSALPTCYQRTPCFLLKSLKVCVCVCCCHAFNPLIVCISLLAATGRRTSSILLLSSLSLWRSVSEALRTQKNSAKLCCSDPVKDSEERTNQIRRVFEIWRPADDWASVGEHNPTTLLVSLDHTHQYPSNYLQTLQLDPYY